MDSIFVGEGLLKGIVVDEMLPIVIDWLENPLSK
jgi:hypothetical protein